MESCRFLSCVGEMAREAGEGYREHSYHGPTQCRDCTVVTKYSSVSASTASPAKGSGHWMKHDEFMLLTMRIQVTLEGVTQEPAEFSSF